MIVMPANSTGPMFHSLARETGRLGHLYSPGAERGPWPWFPYALDNGAFTCWNPTDNTFDLEKWASLEIRWRQLLFWAQTNRQRPLWAIVPDVPGDAAATLLRWSSFASIVVDFGFLLALAVQDGMTPGMVRQLDPKPDVICVGGSTEWKWATVEMWARAFARVHLLRCNSPYKLEFLRGLGVESCDGTGWNRGDKTQTQGLEEWCFRHAAPAVPPHPWWPYACRGERKAARQLRGHPEQQTFA